MKKQKTQMDTPAIIISTGIAILLVMTVASYTTGFATTNEPGITCKLSTGPTTSFDKSKDANLPLLLVLTNRGKLDWKLSYAVYDKPELERESVMVSEKSVQSVSPGTIKISGEKKFSPNIFDASLNIPLASLKNGPHNLRMAISYSAGALNGKSECKTVVKLK